MQVVKHGLAITRHATPPFPPSPCTDTTPYPRQLRAPPYATSSSRSPPFSLPSHAPPLFSPCPPPLSPLSPPGPGRAGKLGTLQGASGGRYEGEVLAGRPHGRGQYYVRKVGRGVAGRGWGWGRRGRRRGAVGQHWCMQSCMRACGHRMEWNGMEWNGWMSQRSGMGRAASGAGEVVSVPLSRLGWGRGAGWTVGGAAEQWRQAGTAGAAGAHVRCVC